jgi:Tol biopolymer transport system component
LSPDGKHIAYAAKTDQKQWVFVVDETEWGPYDKIEEPRKNDHSLYYPDHPVFFSHDSQHTAVTVKLEKMASLVVDGTVVASFQKMGTPVFSPDGKRTAVWASDGDKEFVVLDGKPFAKFEEVDRWQLIFSPDSKHVAYKAKKDKQWYLVVDGTPSANGYERIITAHPDKASFVFSAPDSLYYVVLKGKMLYLVDEKFETGIGENK